MRNGGAGGGEELFGCLFPSVPAFVFVSETNVPKKSGFKPQQRDPGGAPLVRDESKCMFMYFYSFIYLFFYR